MQVEFDHDGHHFKATKVADKDVSIDVDGEFWTIESNLFRPIPDDAEWIKSATIGAWDFHKEGK